MSTEYHANITAYVRGKLAQSLDPTYMFVPPEGLDDNIAHKGLYIGLINSSDKEICRSGFLKDKQTSVLNSLEIAIAEAVGLLKSKNITKPIVETSIIHISIIKDCIYITHPLEWDESSDGIGFQWGQKYKSVYMPYQIKNMSESKINIMDRLCSIEAGVPSNLWKLPEGLVYRLVCESFSG